MCFYSFPNNRSMTNTGSTALWTKTTPRLPFPFLPLVDGMMATPMPCSAWSRSCPIAGESLDRGLMIGLMWLSLDLK